jgi:bacterioferritin
MKSVKFYKNSAIKLGSKVFKKTAIKGVGEMEITQEKLIELLNMDLELEYSAAIQYINHAAIMTGAAYGDIIKELKIHANEEIQHAIILSDQIDYLGEMPSVNVGKIRTSKDNEEMLRQDLDGQEDAIRRYKTRIEQAEQLKEFALAQQLRNILATEQEHAMDLIQALGR